MEPNTLTSLEDALGYRFRSASLAAQALRHRSFVNEQPPGAPPDNERLEFLGDAVLSLVVSHMLIERFPSMGEGDLSRTRAHLVSEPRLARLARRMGLGPLLQLGRGEARSGGRDKSSLLADAFEAVVAAVYLDGGFRSAVPVVSRQFEALFEAVRDRGSRGDAKSRLQELAQCRKLPVPAYRVVAEEGPDHDKTFRVEVSLGGISARGSGKTKKAAEQDAARDALERLEEDA